MAILNVYINYSIFEGSILRYFKANVGHMMEVFDHDEQHSETQDEQRSQTMWSLLFLTPQMWVIPSHAPSNSSAGTFR